MTTPQFVDETILYASQLNAIEADIAAAATTATAAQASATAAQGTANAAKAKADSSVQTVNGVAPDGSGNVNVSGGGGGGGLPVYVAPAQTVANTPGLPVSITAGTGNGTATGGSASLIGGPAPAASATGGGVLVQGGGGTAASGGSVTVAGGDSTAEYGGNVIVRGGNTAASNGGGGSVSVSGGTPTGNSASGSVSVTTPNSLGNNDSGTLTFRTGDAPAFGNPGPILFTSGSNTAAADWNISGAPILFATGHGGGTNSNGGDITFTMGAGAGTGRRGLFRIANLPSVDPGVAGALWLPPSGSVAVSGTVQTAGGYASGRTPGAAAMVLYGQSATSTCVDGEDGGLMLTATGACAYGVPVATPAASWKAKIQAQIVDLNGRVKIMFFDKDNLGSGAIELVYIANIGYVISQKMSNQIGGYVADTDTLAGFTGVSRYTGFSPLTVTLVMAYDAATGIITSWFSANGVFLSKLCTFPRSSLSGLAAISAIAIGCELTGGQTQMQVGVLKFQVTQ